MTTGDIADRVRYSVGGSGVAWRETGDQIVVLDLDGSVYFGLNGSAAALWKRLAAGEASSAELTALLVSGADVEPARAASDVDRFLADLDRYDLLQRGTADR